VIAVRDEQPASVLRELHRDRVVPDPHPRDLAGLEGVAQVAEQAYPAADVELAAHL